MQLCGALFFTAPATTEIYTLSLHDALPICGGRRGHTRQHAREKSGASDHARILSHAVRAHREECYRSEEHTSELQSRLHLVCRLLLEKKKADAVERVCPGARPVPFDHFGDG